MSAKKQQRTDEEPKLASGNARATFEAPRPHYTRHKVLIALTVIVLAIVGFGGYGYLRYNGSLAQVEVAHVVIDRAATTKQLEEAVQHNLDAFRLSIVGPDGATQTYTADQAGISFDVSQTVDQALAKKDQHDPLKSLQWWQKDEVPMVLRVDEDKLADFIDHHATVVTTAPLGATLGVDNGVVHTTDPKPGTGYSLAEPRETLLSAAQAAGTNRLPLTYGVLQPAVDSSKLQPIKAKIERLLGHPNVTFTLQGKVFRPDAATIGSWVEPILPDANKANLEYNSGKIQAYLDGIAKPYINEPRSQVTLTDPGGVVTVLVSGKNGTDIAHKTDIAAAISQQLAHDQVIDQQLIIDDAPYGSVAAQTYDKWLVADLTNKRMYAYEKSTLVNTFRISAGAPATPTAIGQFAIYSKVRAQDMRGSNADGSSYFQPNVEWVNYFFGGMAIHGNYWRPDYWFGQINSSHGCIGLRNPDAKWIYEWAPVGTPVITHL